MDNLKDFADELRNMKKPGELLRPFVCDGSPLDCSVFIVGSNRAARLASEFWTYWDDSHGLDKVRLLTAYDDYRRSRGKPEVAHARNALEVLVHSCRPLRCLETNVFGESTDTRDELLAAPTQGISILPYLVESIKPRWIIAHGVIAGRAVSAYDAKATIVRLPDLRKVAHADLKRLGRRIVDSMLQDRSLGDPTATAIEKTDKTAPENGVAAALDILGDRVSGDADYRNSIVQAILSVARRYQDASLEAACEREIDRRRVSAMSEI